MSKVTVVSVILYMVFCGVCSIFLGVVFGNTVQLIFLPVFVLVGLGLGVYRGVRDLDFDDYS